MFDNGFIRMRLAGNNNGGYALYAYKSDNSGVCVNFNDDAGSIELVKISTTGAWTVLRAWYADL